MMLSRNSLQHIPNIVPPESFEGMPNIYADNQQTHLFSAWDRGRLERRVTEYGRFLQQPNLMPRAQTGADRVWNHLMFELAWRDGVYSNEEIKEKDNGSVLR